MPSPIITLLALLQPLLVDAVIYGDVNNKQLQPDFLQVRKGTARSLVNAEADALDGEMLLGAEFFSTSSALASTMLQEGEAHKKLLQFFGGALIVFYMFWFVGRPLGGKGRGLQEIRSIMFPAKAVESKADDAAIQLRSKHETLRNTVHTLGVKDMESQFGSSLCQAHLRLGETESVGLDEAAKALHLRVFGENKMTPPKRTNRWIMLFHQVFGGLFNIMLWSCVACEIVLAVFLGGDDEITPIVLSLVITASGVLQWWTEQEAESMMNALQNMQTAAPVKTRRQKDGIGFEAFLSAEELLPGDVVILEAGEKVPADVRILDCTDVALVDNAALTGESVAEPRKSGLAPPNLPLMESSNVAFCGTSVIQGRMVCVVMATGDNTFLGQIASKISGSRTRSSLEVQIEHFVHLIALVAVAVGALSLVANVLSPRKRSHAEILENAATAFFAQVPEGLLPTVTVCLMISSRKMATRQVLVRKIDAVETLGCVSVLCSDKTGTLTSGKMTATDIVVPSKADAGLEQQPLPVKQFSVDQDRLGLCAALNSTVKASADGTLTGSPTEVAICEGCVQLFDSGSQSADRIRASRPIVYEVPFSSSTKWMLTIHGLESQDALQHMAIEKPCCLAILKGAPERVLQLCDAAPEFRMAIEAQLEALMSQGKRVLCFADKILKDVRPGFEFKGSSPDDANFPMHGFVFRGLVGIEDPPKDGVINAIERVRRAGAKTIMVTGDHPSTAEAIARRIGLIDQPEDEEQACTAETYRVVSGAELEKQMPDNDDFESASPESAEFWRACVEQTRVFARVSPLHKRAIVRAYQHFGGHITAMTGDGVNDAPALKEAEVGIAMGIRGTEVAKEAADIVLLDDDLQSVVEGMEQGRLCSENLRKSISYTLCSKLPQVLPTFFELMGMPCALSAAQVLLIDIGTDIWTAIAFAWQPAESELMERAPRHPRKDRMVNGSVLLYSYGYIGILQAVTCWFAFLIATPQMYRLFQDGRPASLYSVADTEANYAGMTEYYWTLVLGQVGAALAATTAKQSVFNGGFPNKWLTLCIVLEIMLALLVIFWGPLQHVFRTRALEGSQLAAGFVALFVVTFAEEGRKFISRRSSSAA